MYRKYRQRPNKTGNFNRFNGHCRRGTRKVKFFNPVALINNPQVAESCSEYLVVHSFSDFEITDKLKKNILEKGYSAPTPIQDQAIEPILEGRDLVGIANTGTGKTAAFLIPLINKVLNKRNERVLILAPTRELAIQIRNELYGFAKNLNLFSCLCIGGENRRRQIRQLSSNPNFVIATPGRILDLIRAGAINPALFNSIVIDEADRMVDIGFIGDIKFIISLLPKERQSLFFSATIDSKVQQILQDFVNNPVTVSVKVRDTAINITQKVVAVHGKNSKVEVLHNLLIQEDFLKVLVFGRTKHGVQKLSNELVKRGFKALAIHGNKNQSQRSKAIELFKRDEIKILIATDVASRGLDIPNVSHVINYDLPESKDAYIHRIGRTGRADKKGVALTFID